MNGVLFSASNGQTNENGHSNLDECPFHLQNICKWARLLLSIQSGYNIRWSSESAIRIFMQIRFIISGW